MARRKRFLAAALMAALLLGGCGNAQPNNDTLEVYEENAVPAAAFRTAVYYTAPALTLSEFHADLAEGPEDTRIDLSAVSMGYFAVSASSDRRLKLQVIKGDDTYTYNIASDGTPSVLPLQCGDGSYHIRVMENVVDTRYAQIYAVDCEVELADPFAPFLVPSDYVNYNADSSSVTKARELAEGAGSALDVVTAVYAYIVRNVRYDSVKATTVNTGYLPDPDETLRTGEGICFDYASLAAAMLRSQGIPTKLIFGYVSPDDIYHAWNMFYTEETGWVTVSYEVRSGLWNRLDLTFSAGGASDEFVGDGGNYSEVYQY